MPTHAPELMPVEFLWRWLKYDRLCNFAPRDAPHLNEAIVSELKPIWEDQKLPRSFFNQSDLPLSRALLSWDAMAAFPSKINPPDLLHTPLPLGFAPPLKLRGITGDVIL